MNRPSPRPHAIITAGQRRTADALCEMYAAELWTEAEREAFREMKADGNGGPIFTCWCGAQSSNGSCPLGHRS